MIAKKGSSLILEGGATRGIFTSGVLDYLMEQDYYIPNVIGVSMGACNGTGYLSRQVGRTRNCIIQDGDGENYLDIKNAIKNRSLFDMDLIFDKYPKEIYPFDFETFFASPLRLEMVVTNCLTGQAEYLSEMQDPERLMQIARASSSMPMVCPVVMLEGQPYLDGGIADSIPILHSIKTGHKKNVLILTRQKGYRKKPIQKSRPLYLAALKAYPNLYRALMNRAKIYNKTLSYVEKWEKEGKVFVIRPTVKPVSRTETNKDNLTAFYQHGYDIMKAQFEAMKEFIGD